jgi:hypothetical protein
MPKNTQSNKIFSEAKNLVLQTTKELKWQEIIYKASRYLLALILCLSVTAFIAFCPFFKEPVSMQLVDIQKHLDASRNVAEIFGLFAIIGYVVVALFKRLHNQQSKKPEKQNSLEDPFDRN